MEERLIDEITGRTVAHLMDITPRGTVFVLLKALEREFINFDIFLKTLNDLIGEGFRLREEVFIKAIERAREASKS